MVGIGGIANIVVGVKQLSLRLACLFPAVPNLCIHEQPVLSTDYAADESMDIHSSSGCGSSEYYASLPSLSDCQSSHGCSLQPVPAPARWSGIVRPIITLAQLEAALSENRRSLALADFSIPPSADELCPGWTVPGLRFPSPSLDAEPRRSLRHSSIASRSSFGTGPGLYPHERGLTPPPEHFRRRARALNRGNTHTEGKKRRPPVRMSRCDPLPSPQVLPCQPVGASTRVQKVSDKPPILSPSRKGNAGRPASDFNVV